MTWQTGTRNQGNPVRQGWHAGRFRPDVGRYQSQGRADCRDGDAALADRLLVVCGMDPVSGKTGRTACSLPPMPAEIAAHMVAHGSPLRARGTYAASRQDLCRGGGIAMADLRSQSIDAKPRRFRHTILGSPRATGKPASGARWRCWALTSDIGFIAGYDSGHGPKPEPGMLLAFALHLGLHPSQIAMVGDNGHDMEMAGAAGAGAAIGVLSGTGTRQTLEALADVLHRIGCRSGADGC
jgi:phosphoglycolate phosphatase